MSASYREFVIQGDLKLLKGFLWGYRIALRVESGLVLCRDRPIDAHHLREILTIQADHVHFLADETLTPGILEAIAAARDLGFEIVSTREVKRTAFAFEFETFSRKEAARIKDLLAKLPRGLALADYEPDEQRDAKAKGVEMYAPVHDFAFRGKGTIEGNVESLLDLHATLGRDELFRIQNITIEH